MKVFLTLAFILCLTLSSQAQLNITFSDVESTKGKLVLSIYTSESSFKSKEALLKSTIPLNGQKLEYKNQNLQPGYYMITVFHDLNDNNKFDRNFMGIPKEPYGVSNNAKEKFGPPKYENARFYYDGNSLKLMIKIDRT